MQAVPRGRCTRFEAVDGGSASINTLGAHAVAKQTKPINSYSLFVQVEPEWHLHLKEAKTVQILEAMWHA